MEHYDNNPSRSNVREDFYSNPNLRLNQQTNTAQLDQLQEALLLQGRLLQEEEEQLNANISKNIHHSNMERLSPASSISSSCQEQALPTNNNTINGSIGSAARAGKLKKRSTSTSSGLKSLGRIFSGSKKNKLTNSDIRLLFIFIFLLFIFC